MAQQLPQPCCVFDWSLSAGDLELNDMSFVSSTGADIAPASVGTHKFHRMRLGSWEATAQLKAMAPKWDWAGTAEQPQLAYADGAFLAARGCVFAPDVHSEAFVLTP